MRKKEAFFVVSLLKINVFKAMLTLKEIFQISDTFRTFVKPDLFALYIQMHNLK